MAEYFVKVFCEGFRAPGYIPTVPVEVLALILLLGRAPKKKADYVRVAMELLAFSALSFLVTAAYSSVFGEYNMDYVSLMVVTLAYAVTRSPYSPMRRLVLGFMFVACTFCSYPLSEPWGELFSRINADYFQSAGWLTVVVLAAMLTAQVLFLKHFALEEGSSILPQYALIQVGVSTVTIVIELVYGIEGVYGVGNLTVKVFNIVAGTALWGINLLLYYMLYNISRSNDEKIMLLSTQHKIQMEQEKYEANRVNYDELRAMRHELKNYTFYVRALLEAQRYDELKEFLDHAAASKSKALTSYDCGNYTIDVIMNHEINAAREQGVAVRPDILVPHQLPIADDALCSLLSNMMDNAIEAAASSGSDAPFVSISIRPKQEYLFIHQVNSVGSDVPAERRLSLETTKRENRELHGIGTRVIRRIVEAYNGSVKYSMADGLMTTDVMIELRRDGE